MDVERSLLSKIILDGDIAPLTDARIGRMHFADPANQAVYDSIVRHVADYSQVPTLAIVRMDHPDYRWATEVPESFAYLLDQVREAREQTLIEQALAASVQALDHGRVAEARQHLSAGLNKIAEEIPRTTDVDITSATEDTWAYYQSVKALQGRLRGIPTGFASLDTATQGWQPGNFVVMYGVAKSGKSTLLLNSAMACHRHGKTPMFAGFEMSNREQQERHIAFWAGLNFERLRSGELSVPEERQLRRGLNQLANMPPFVMTTDLMGTATVDALAAKMAEHRPDVLYLDGVYMMDDLHGEQKMSPQALSNICQGLKQLAMSTGIPIVCTTQALESKLGRGRRLTSGSVGYSSAFAQYADALIGVEQTEEPAIQRVSQILGRNSRPFETYLRWDWTRGAFTELDYNPFLADEDDDEIAYASGF